MQAKAKRRENVLEAERLEEIFLAEVLNSHAMAVTVSVCHCPSPHWLVTFWPLPRFSHTHNNGH